MAHNRALLKCMEGGVPVLVVITHRGKEHPGGARYRFLGPALITNFNQETGLFEMQGSTPAVVASLRLEAAEDDLARMEVRDGLAVPFQLAETRTRYALSRDARSRAFRSIVLEEYRCLCCVCRSLFLLRDADGGHLVEAEAAHIISVHARGPDDPRNGLSLCQRHHWAFDAGLFTLTDALEIKVSGSVARAERQKFDLEEYGGEPITPPVRESCRPDQEALDWHRSKVFRAA